MGPKATKPELTRAEYVIIETTITRCPRCDKHVQLLQDRAIRKTKPMFYICFHCDLVVQVGKGFVKGE